MPVRKVLTSLQEHWSGLTLFVEDVRVPMDNNLSERRLRGPALGRKNYYGSGALWSGQLAATLFSILATLELWGLNPRLWLHWYLQSCAEAGGKVPRNRPASQPDQSASGSHQDVQVQEEASGASRASAP